VPAAHVRRALPLSEHRRGQILVSVGALAWSLAGVLQRPLDVDRATQVAGRALFAFAALAVWVRLRDRRSLTAPYRALGGAGLAVALAMAVASGAFMLALSYTTVAQVLFIQAASPMAAALLARVTLGERLSGRTAVALVVSLVGVTVMVGGPGSGSTLGSALALLVMASFSVAIVFTRARRGISMAPAAALSQLLLVCIAMPLADLSAAGRDDWILLALLGVVQMGVGLAAFSAGARLIPAAQAGMLTLLEVVLGPLWVWAAVGERPGTATLVGGAIVVAAVVIAAQGGSMAAPAPARPADEEAPLRDRAAERSTPEVADDLAGAVLARPACDASAGMRPGAAEIEP
jgi:drug/metabolite transporter (DMT)-like permease